MSHTGCSRIDSLQLWWVNHESWCAQVHLSAQCTNHIRGFVSFRHVLRLPLLQGVCVHVLIQRIDGVSLIVPHELWSILQHVFDSIVDQYSKLNQYSTRPPNIGFHHSIARHAAIRHLIDLAFDWSSANALFACHSSLAQGSSSSMYCAVLCCAVLCCVVLCCAVRTPIYS